MQENKEPIKSDLAKIDAHVIQPEEYEEIPELNDEWFARADFYSGSNLVQHGKVPVQLMLDKDLVDHFRSQGKDWRAKMSTALAELTQQH